MKYIYYQIYRFYKRWGDRASDIAAVGLITLVECCNILAVLYLFTYYRSFKIEISIWSIVPIGGLYLLNYFYFKKISSTDIKKWDAEDPTRRDTKGALIILYIALSIAFPFYLATKIYNQTHGGFLT